MTDPNIPDIEWLVAQSMLQSAKRMAHTYSGQGRMWQNQYTAANPRAATELASVWFTAYPDAMITADGESLLATWSKPLFWQYLANIGIKGIHTGPMKRAGGLVGQTYTPTIDGQFDRISFDVDPRYGTEAEFLWVSQVAKQYNIVLINDVIPAHTGKGADFRLAERNYADYPGLYHMIEIRHEDWTLLPAVPAGADSVNLSADIVDSLQAKGYIVGRLPRTIFYEPGIKETDWSATNVVVGVDGVARRWVYLHYFKQGQPALNWLDPTFAAQQMIIGDALHSLDLMGARGLRLDANGFLGIERMSDGTVWSEGHPLSVIGNQLIATMVRKIGGFTFQELNLTVDDIAFMSNGGADLSYDFITRPAYHHALVTSNTSFLRLMLRQVHAYDIDPMSLIHALQNHDELTLELVHFWTKHKDDSYVLDEVTWTGTSLRDDVRAVMYAALSGTNAPYNLPFVTNGVACTTVTVIAAALGISDITTFTSEQKALIQRIHLLLVMYNAFQPGIFALSGWDLVGALTLPRHAVADLLTDGDTRWINRGAYDLVDVNPETTTSAEGLPKAPMLYGSLPSQMQEPDSFVRQLQHLLAVRQQYRIYASRQLPIPDVEDKGLLLMLHELPDNMGIQVTALNFGAKPVTETIVLSDLADQTVTNMLNNADLGSVGANGDLTINLAGYEGQSLLIK